MDVIVTADGYRTFHGLQELNEDKLQEFLEVVKRAYVKKPNQKDLDELRKWINSYPELWKVVFDTALVIEQNFIKNMVGDKAAIIAMQKNTDEIRAGMGYAQASIMEQMLIDSIVVSWLSVQYANYQLINRMKVEEKITILEFWERRLSMAQRRYLHACESLVKIRRLVSEKPTVQVNIAAKGGQQVNVAGDVKK